MTERGYLATFQLRWRFVVVPLVACLGLWGLLALVLPREYESSTTIYVGSTSDGRDVNRDYQGGLLIQQRMASYTQILTSTQIGGEVARRLGLDLPADEVAATMTATRESGSSVITLTVKDGSPEQAAAVARAAAESFLQLMASYEQPADPRRPPAIVLRVLDPPEIPQSPTSPQPALFLGLGLVSGLLLGVTAALVRDATDNRIWTPDDLAEAGERPVLGFVTTDPAPDATRSAESIRQVRANLKFATATQPPAVVVLTSPVHGEGVLPVAINLALALGEDGAKVCLVEADIRAPCLASLLDLGGAPGLTSVLTGHADVEDVTRSLGGSTDVVVAGIRPPNPSELVGSAAMSDLLARLRNRYDVVLVNGPPILPVTDTSILARRSDGAVVVTRAGSTTRTDLVRSLVALEKGSVRVLGTVLNGLPPGAGRVEPSRATQATGSAL